MPSAHSGFLNTVKEFITTAAMVSLNLRGMKFLGGLGILKDTETLAKNLNTYAPFSNPTCWHCLSLFLRKRRCWEAVCL